MMSRRNALSFSFGSFCIIVSILSSTVITFSNAERVLPTTSVFFNPGEYWIEDGEKGNNLLYDEFVQCVDDLANATETYGNEMNQLNQFSYLEFLKLQTDGIINEPTFQNLLPEISNAYWNLVCIIVGDGCSNDSTVTLDDIENYALDNGGWLIYQLCSRIDEYLDKALLSDEPSSSPTDIPSPSPTTTPTISPSMYPSSSPSTKEKTFEISFKLTEEVPSCYGHVLPLLMEERMRAILKCKEKCAGELDLNIETTTTITREYSTIQIASILFTNANGDAKPESIAVI